MAYLLRDGYVEEYEFGFRRDDERLVSWRYKVVNGSLNSTDDRPGKLLTGVDVATASHFNFLRYSSAWARLSQQDRERIEGSLPIKRTTGQPPKDGLGYWVEDRCPGRSRHGNGRVGLSFPPRVSSRCSRRSKA